MPNRLTTFRIFADGDEGRQAFEPLADEFADEQQANEKADELTAQTGRPHHVLPMDEETLDADEVESEETLYLLTCEVCNMEYGEVVHRTLHRTVEGAKAKQAKMLIPEHLKGEDAINEWREKDYEPGILEFRTGNWGYIVWTIRPLRLIA